LTNAPEDSPPLRRIIFDPDLDGGTAFDGGAFRRAAQFMSTARQIQRKSGRSLSGRKRRSVEMSEASTGRSQDNSPLAPLGRRPEPDVPVETQRQVFEAFETMCRWRQVTLPPDLRPAVYRLLGIELAVNIHVFNARPEQVASTTV